MIYTCGTELNKNDCGCYISVQLGCDSVINQNYYKFELGEIVCHKCGAELDQGDKENIVKSAPHSRLSNQAAISAANGYMERTRSHPAPLRLEARRNESHPANLSSRPRNQKTQRNPRRSEKLPPSQKTSLPRSPKNLQWFINSILDCKHILKHIKIHCTRVSPWERSRTMFVSEI